MLPIPYHTIVLDISTSLSSNDARCAAYLADPLAANPLQGITIARILSGNKWRYWSMYIAALCTEQIFRLTDLESLYKFNYIPSQSGSICTSTLGPTSTHLSERFALGVGKVCSCTPIRVQLMDQLVTIRYNTM